MKSSRLLEMVLLLQAKNPRPARELALSLEVSERTIYRDVDALSAAGVPIFATRGALGGIHLVEGYRKAISELEEDEIRALYVAGADPLADLGLGRPLARAREKLSAVLSARQQTVAEETRARIHVDQRRWGQETVPVEMLAILRRAVWDDRRIKISYRDRNGARSSRTLDPLGLVAKSGIWYVIGRDGTEYRSFRTDRIVAAELLDERFSRPADFSLDDYWSQSTRRFQQNVESCKVTLRAKEDKVDGLCAYWKPTSVETGNSEAIVRFEFPARGAAISQILAWGNDVTVIEPLELITELLERARAVLANYAAPTRPL